MMNIEKQKFFDFYKLNKSESYDDVTSSKQGIPMTSRILLFFIIPLFFSAALAETKGKAHSTFPKLKFIEQNNYSLKKISEESF